MNKISPEYLPKDDSRLNELYEKYEAKSAEYIKAVTSGNQELADKIYQEQKNLATELRMINPDIEISKLENHLHAEADFETKDLHSRLNEKRIN